MITALTMHKPSRAHAACLLLALLWQAPLCWAQATSPAVQGPQNQWRYKVTPSFYQTTPSAALRSVRQANAWS